MTVRLRMAVHGTKRNRIFHLVAIDHRRRRDGKPIELLGMYDPYPNFDKHGEHSHKTMKWSVDRIKYWLGVGAVPSKPVVRFLEWVGYKLVLDYALTQAQTTTGRCNSIRLQISFQVVERSYTQL